MNILDRMLKSPRLLIIASLFLLGFLLIIDIWSPSATSQNKEAMAMQELQHYAGPIVDYDRHDNLLALTAPNEREMRVARSKRYDDRVPWPLGKFPPEMTEYSISSHWEIGLPSLPTAQSDAVVMGEVANAQASLSNDKSGVYSEFTVIVKAVFKDNSEKMIKPEATIIVEREGGVVRFKDGRLLRYKVLKQGLPHPGGRYVFFLKHNRQGEDYSTITAYELRSGQVIPLDGADIKEESGKLQFAAYEGMDEKSFLSDLRRAIIYPPETPQPFIKRNPDEGRQKPTNRRSNE